MESHRVRAGFLYPSGKRTTPTRLAIIECCAPLSVPQPFALYLTPIEEDTLRIAAESGSDTNPFLTRTYSYYKKRWISRAYSVR